MKKQKISLSRLKRYAIGQRDGGGTCNVNPAVLVALIECAVIVQTDYLLLSDDQQMKALQSLKVLE